MSLLQVTASEDSHVDGLSGAVCWLWWAAESEEGRRQLLQAMAAESGQSLRTDAAPQVLA